MPRLSVDATPPIPVQAPVRQPRTMAPNDPTVALSPFVPALTDGVTAALRELLGMPAHLPFVWHEQQADPWRMDVTVGDVALQLHAPGHGPAYFAGERLALVYRGAEAPPLLPALVRRLRHAEQDGAPVDALHAALRAWRPFKGMQDTDFRNVSDIEAILRVGFRCNQDCGFCWQGRDWPGPPRAVLERWIDEMAARGVEQLMISGGEPTVYAEL